MKKFIFFLAIGLLVCGCATVERDEHLASLEQELFQLQQENALLRKELTTTERELATTERELAETEEELEVLKSKPVKVEVKLPTGRQIQTALRNAGFYRGKIDGVIGAGTKRAIKSFQKSEGLNADGVVGSRTWERLREYLN
ncbi:MAG: peptidoglycan-binding protein [Candidatus Omnitrophota bacterium]|nr:MAG: peptidoglycan-binding protein [Candidatus Omnitrophota bacterium]